MYKACSKCGRVHDTRYKCNHNRVYKGGKERELRNLYSWHKKSEQIREKAQYLCEVCKAKGIYTYNNLEAHHITKVRDDPDKLLDDYNIICLCQEHHKQADRGEIDADYLRELAMKRENDW